MSPRSGPIGDYGQKRTLNVRGLINPEPLTVPSDDPLNEFRLGLVR
jgi:hypothetical protein